MRQLVLGSVQKLARHLGAVVAEHCPEADFPNRCDAINLVMGAGSWPTGVLETGAGLTGSSTRGTPGSVSWGGRGFAHSQRA